MISSEQARDFVQRRARIRVHSGAIGVSLTCYKDSCDPYHHGSVAYYSGSGALLGKPYFASLALGEFLAFVAEHAASHADGGASC